MSGAFNLTTQTQPHQTQNAAFHLNSSQSVKPQSLPQTGSQPTTMGSVNMTRQSNLNIRMAGQAEGCDCTGKRTTSLGENNRPGPTQTVQNRSGLNKQNNTAPIRMAGHAEGCDCTGKRTTSLGENNRSGPTQTVQNRSGLNKQNNTTPIRMASHAEGCDCTGKRTTSLGENNRSATQTIPQESLQKVNQQRAASITGFDASSAKLGQSKGLRGSPGSSSSSAANTTQPTASSSTTHSYHQTTVSKAPTAQSVANSASNSGSASTTVSGKAAVSVQPGAVTSAANVSAGRAVPTQAAQVTPNLVAKTSVQPLIQGTALIQTAAPKAAAQTVLTTNFVSALNAVPLKGKAAPIQFGSAVQVFGNVQKANSTVAQAAAILPGVPGKAGAGSKINIQTLMQALQNPTVQKAFNKGLPVTTLQEALNLKNPKLVEKMLQVKANTYGYISLEAVKTAIQNNFMRNDALRQLLELLYGRVMKDFPEVELEGALKAYAEWIQEERQKKLLKEEKERQRRRQKLLVQSLSPEEMTETETAQELSVIFRES